MSDKPTLKDLLERVRALGPMTRQQLEEQRVDWAYGNLAATTNHRPTREGFARFLRSRGWTEERIRSFVDAPHHFTWEPLPCPRCGRTPRLALREHGEGYLARYTCRRWYRRRACFPDAPAVGEARREVVAQEAASILWNLAVRMERVTRG